MYNLATATAWILLPDLGTVRLTICLSSSDRIEGIVAGYARRAAASTYTLAACGSGGGGWEGLSAAVGRWRVRFSGGVVLAQCLGST